MSGIFGGGGGSSQTTTSKTEPWGPAQDYLKDIMSQAQNIYANQGAGNYQKDVVGFNPVQNQAIDMLTQLYGGTSASGGGASAIPSPIHTVQPGAGSVVGTTLPMRTIQPNFDSATVGGQVLETGGYRSPVQNMAQVQPSPYQQGINEATGALSELLGTSPEQRVQSDAIQNMIGAGQQNLMEQLTENTLGKIRSGAAGAGQYGSSRQGLAEANAIGETQDAMANLAAQITGDVYQQGLQSQLAALGEAPTIGDYSTSAGKGLLNLGNLMQSQQQKEADTSYFNETQAPWSRLANYYNIVGGLGGAGQSGSQTTSGGDSGGSDLLNTALTIGSFFL